MADNFSTMSTPIGQRLEIFTELFLIHGLMTLSSGRTSDVLNRATTDFLILHDATITPLGLTPNPKVLDNPVMIRRTLINFLAELPPDKPAQAINKGASGASGSLAGREAYVRKATFPCYAITGPFAIYGQSYLHPGTTLENLLQGVDIFIPITKTTIYVLNRPDLTWQRDLVILNKTLLIAMYMLPATES